MLYSRFRPKIASDALKLSSNSFIIEEEEVSKDGSNHDNDSSPTNQAKNFSHIFFSTSQGRVITIKTYSFIFVGDYRSNIFETILTFGGLTIVFFAIKTGRLNWKCSDSRENLRLWHLFKDPIQDKLLVLNRINGKATTQPYNKFLRYFESFNLRLDLCLC